MFQPVDNQQLNFENPDPRPSVHREYLPPTAGPWIEQSHRLSQMPIAFEFLGSPNTGKSRLCHKLTDQPGITTYPTEVHIADFMTLYPEEVTRIFERYIHRYRYCFQLLHANVAFAHLRRLAGIDHHFPEILGTTTGTVTTQLAIIDKEARPMNTIPRPPWEVVVSTFRERNKLVNADLLLNIEKTLHLLGTSLRTITLEDQVLVLSMLKWIFHEVDFDEMIRIEQSEATPPDDTSWWTYVLGHIHLGVDARFPGFVKTANLHRPFGIFDQDWMSVVLYLRTCNELGHTNGTSENVRTLRMDEFINPSPTRRNEALHVLLLFMAENNTVMERERKVGHVMNPFFQKEFWKQTQILSDALRNIRQRPFLVCPIDGNGDLKNTEAQVVASVNTAFGMAGRPQLGEFSGPELLVDFAKF